MLFISLLFLLQTGVPVSYPMIPMPLYQRVSREEPSKRRKGRRGQRR